MLTVKDDYSRKFWVYFLRPENETFPMFKKFKGHVEKHIWRKIKKLRIDSGLEFCGSDFIEFYAIHGIARHKTLLRKPQQNGVTEHINWTILGRAHCILSNVNL